MYICDWSSDVCSSDLHFFFFTRSLAFCFILSDWQRNDFVCKTLPFLQHVRSCFSSGGQKSTPKVSAESRPPGFGGGGGGGGGCSVAQSCMTLCDPKDCSMPGLPVHHQLPELDQTHVHRVGDAIQSSHPLASPSPPVFNLSQHQGLLQWVGSSH